MGEIGKKHTKVYTKEVLEAFGKKSKLSEKTKAKMYWMGLWND